MGVKLGVGVGLGVEVKVGVEVELGVDVALGVGEGAIKGVLKTMQAIRRRDRAANNGYLALIG